MYDVGDLVAHKLALQRLLRSSQQQHDDHNDDDGDTHCVGAAAQVSSRRPPLQACFARVVASTTTSHACAVVSCAPPRDDDDDDDDSGADVCVGATERVRVSQLHRAVVMALSSLSSSQTAGDATAAAAAVSALPRDFSLYVRAYMAFATGWALLWRELFASPTHNSSSNNNNDDDDSSRSSISIDGVPWHVCLTLARRRWAAHLQRTTRELLTRVVARALPLCGYVVYMLLARLDGCVALLQSLAEACVLCARLCASPLHDARVRGRRRRVYMSLVRALASARRVTHAQQQLTSLWQRYKDDYNDDDHNNDNEDDKAPREQAMCRDDAGCGAYMRVLQRLHDDVAVRATLLHGQHIAHAVYHTQHNACGRDDNDDDASSNNNDTTPHTAPFYLFDYDDEDEECGGSNSDSDGDDGDRDGDIQTVRASLRVQRSSSSSRRCSSCDDDDDDGSRSRGGVLAFVAQRATTGSSLARVLHAVLHRGQHTHACLRRYPATLLVLRHQHTSPARVDTSHSDDDEDDENDDDCLTGSYGGALAQWSLQMVLPSTRLAHDGDDDVTRRCTRMAAATTALSVAQRRRRLLLQLLVFNVAACEDDDDDDDDVVTTFAHPHSAFYVLRNRRLCGRHVDDNDEGAVTLYFVLHLHIAQERARTTAATTEAAEAATSTTAAALTREEAVLRSAHDVCVAQLRHVRAAWSMTSTCALAAQLVEATRLS